MLDEIQTLFLLQGGLQVAGSANKAGLALLANAAFKLRFDEDRFVPVDKTLDVVLACAGSKHFGAGKST